MRTFKRFGMAALACVLVAGNAWADRDWRHDHHPHSSVRFGFYVGSPWLFPPFYPYPVYEPRVVVPQVVVTAPPVYVEQRPAPAASQTLESGYWYYCDEARAYYPYVQQCPGPWRKVQPQPPR